MASGMQYYGGRGQEGNRRFDYGQYANKVYRYRTDHPRRGTCLIINNYSFTRQEGIQDRNGTKCDVTALEGTFRSLGFNVIVKENRRCGDMVRDVEEATSDDENRLSDCFGFILMTHGTSDGYYYGTDGRIHLDQLLYEFKEGKCPDSLIGKPKIFIIQGCRGGKQDHGMEVCDAEPVAPRSYYIPRESDKVFIYACAPEHEAYRHTGNGSWFIQVLCGVLREHSINTHVSPPTEGREFMWMMQRVCHVVAEEFDDATAQYPLKQMPQITYNLTKELYFTPKYHQQETAVRAHPSGFDRIEADSSQRKHPSS